jgi:5-methylcytosine-specific restriction endonuclease McrA
VSWCDNIINVFNFQVGHDIPESKGGTLDIDNLKPICGNCNLSMSNNYSIKEWSNLIKNKSISDNNKSISDNNKPISVNNNNTTINDNTIIRPETLVNKDTVITPETVITPDIKEYPETNETNELQRNNSFLNTICNKLPTIPLQLPLITMILYPLKYIRI